MSEQTRMGLRLASVLEGHRLSSEGLYAAPLVPDGTRQMSSEEWAEDIVDDIFDVPDHLRFARLSDSKEAE